MIYAYDEPIVFPTIDLYDSGMMGAYLTAAKDLYDNALKELKDFLDKYGEFVSPIDNDVNFWYELGLQPILDTQDAIWNRGGDPLRNPLDRAELSRAMNRIPRATFAKLKLSAAAAEKYLENKAKLESEGKWNPEFEKMILNNMGLPDFEHWDTSKNGPWSRLSPGEFKDLNTYTSHVFDDLKDSFIGRTQDGKWLINGVNEKAMRDALTQHLGGIVGSDLGKWYYNQAKNELISEGNGNPSDADIMKRLQDNIITANAERIHTKLEADEFVKQLMSDAAALLRTLVSGRGRGNSGGGGGGGQLGPYLPWDTGVSNGLMAASGTSPSNANQYTMGTGMLLRAYDAAAGIRSGKVSFSEDDLATAFGTSDPSDFNIRAGLKTNARLGNDYYNITGGQRNRLYSSADIMMQSIYGYGSISKHGYVNTKAPFVSSSNNVVGISANSGYNTLVTVPMRDGTVHQFQSVNTAGLDDKGNKVDYGNFWYDYGPVGYLIYDTEDGKSGYVTASSVKISKDGKITARGKDNEFVGALVRVEMNPATQGERARTNAVVNKNISYSNSASPRPGTNGADLYDAYDEGEYGE